MNDDNRRARENLLARLDWLDKQEAEESPHSREFPDPPNQGRTRTLFYDRSFRHMDHGV